MPKRFTFAFILVLVFGGIADANAGSTLRMTCNGNFMNTSSDGVTLGECDLNFIPVKQMEEIEHVCGIPGTVDTPAENQCRIRAVVAPDQHLLCAPSYRPLGDPIEPSQEFYRTALAFQRR
jgi:hypothetical protein